MSADQTPGRIKVAVVFGGRSTEHAISCVSAGSVLKALDRDRFEVVPVGITRSGRWVLAGDDAAGLEIVQGQLPEVDDAGASLVLAADPTAGGLVISEPGAPPRLLSAVDVVFPLLHGPYGEDGTLQGLLELAGVPYVGSGVLASALAMDKAMAKVVLAAKGLHVGAHELVTDAQWLADQSGSLARVMRSLALPVFVKPARAGSSVGITKVDDWGDLSTAVEDARRHDPRVIVEQAVRGREIECGVLEGLDGGVAEASVCAEIRVVGDHAFYDFEAKYLDGATEFTVPADLDEDVSARVRSQAIQAFEALGCEGLARVDFFLTDTGELVINEVNTIPGFTPVSMFPRMWAETGLAYPALVNRLLMTALARRSGLR